MYSWMNFDKYIHLCNQYAMLKLYGASPLAQKVPFAPLWTNKFPVINRAIQYDNFYFCFVIYAYFFI